MEASPPLPLQISCTTLIQNAETAYQNGCPSPSCTDSIHNSYTASILPARMEAPLIPLQILWIILKQKAYCLPAWGPISFLRRFYTHLAHSKQECLPEWGPPFPSCANSVNTAYTEGKTVYQNEDQPWACLRQLSGWPWAET